MASKLKTPIPPVAGYRKLSRAEVDAMNRLKVLEEAVLEELDRLASASVQQGGYDPDGRWLSIGRTHIEQGFMALCRSIAKPRRLSDAPASDA